MKHSSPIEAGPISPEDAAARDRRIDAINQVFALFRLNYHAQFFKAFATESELTQIKKLWFTELSRFDPSTMLKAAKAILETSDYLPTLHTMIRHCESFSEQTLPDPHSAYIEPCRAPSPKIDFNWSHPVVYHAGKACDWYFLQSSAESVAYPVFKRQYAEFCQRARTGETFEMPNSRQVEHDAAKPLDKEANLKKLKALRETLDL